MSVEKQWAGQCEAWWDARVNRMVDWPKHLKPGAPELVLQVMRCVMEAGHEPVPDLKDGHNFGGLGPYTPGMPGWKAQQRALGLSKVVALPASEGATEWQREAWVKLPDILREHSRLLWELFDAAEVPPIPRGGIQWPQRPPSAVSAPWSWTPPAEPGPEVRRVRPVERYAGDDGIRYDREPDNSGWRLVMMGRRGEVIEWLQVLAGAGSIYGGRQLIDATSELAEEGREG